MTEYKNHLKVDWDKLIMYAINRKAATKSLKPSVTDNRLYAHQA